MSDVGGAEVEVSEQLLKGQSVSMILLRCQDILKNAGRSLSTYDLQTYLAQSSTPSKVYTSQYYIHLFSDPNLITILRNNTRIHYDPRARKWSFKSPFDDVTSVELLSKRIDACSCVSVGGPAQAVADDSQTWGLEVTQELLDANPKMSDWIYRLLEEKRVRAIRAGKVGKCKFFTGDFVCNVYDPRSKKCENCKVLRNLILFSKARPASDNVSHEMNDDNFKVDEDIKELYQNIKLPEMKRLMEELRNKQKMKQLELKKKPRKRGEGSNRTRVNKVANLHIYTLDEFKTELGTQK